MTDEKDITSQTSTRRLRPLILMLIALVILVVLMCSLSLAIVVYDKEGSVVNSIKTGGSIMIMYIEGDKGINITNAAPMSDEVGRQLSGDDETFHFTVSAELKNATARYEIAAIKNAASTLSDSDIRLYLEKSVNDGAYTASMNPSPFIPIWSQTALGAPEGSMIMEAGELTQTQTNDYILRMWLKDSYVVDPDNPKSYTVTVNVYAAD